MIFTSYAFLLAVGLLFLLYYLVPKRLQWKLLLLASVLFYWRAGHSYLIYIGITTSATYLAAQKIRTAQQKAQRKWILAVCLLVDIGLLAVLKYGDFFLENWYAVTAAYSAGSRPAPLHLVLPLGISFYTFQAVGYLLDVYWEKYEPETNFGKFALFVSFFPQLVQGPISRYDELAESLYEEHTFQAKTAAYGLQRILWGYFKKLVIADRIFAAVRTLMQQPEQYGGVYVLVGMLLYALQLYADFTGGIDIAIGIAEGMGIRLRENFRRPYFAKSIKEYWTRWHISMGTWFRDYLFYPLSAAEWMITLNINGRKYLGEAIGKRLPVYFATMLVWFATGIWHGASWNFVVWGLANGIVILLSQELTPLYRRFHRRFPVEGRWWFRLFQILRTLTLMSCLRMFDCYRDVRLTFHMLGSLLTEFCLADLWDGRLTSLGLDGRDCAVLVCGTLLLLAVSLLQRSGKVRDKIAAKPYPVRFCIWYGLFLLVLLTGAYGHGYEESRFIYDQF